MKKILVISFSDLKNDPRVSRQIEWLSEKYHVISVGFSLLDIENVQGIVLQRTSKVLLKKIYGVLIRLAHQYERFYWQEEIIKNVCNSLVDIEVDLIIANDIDTLPLSLSLYQDKKVIFDAHEYSPLEFEDKFIFRFIRKTYISFLCNKYIPKTSAMLTVCESISNAYYTDTTVKPTVMTNSPKYEDLEPNLLTDRTKIRLIHHGNANPSRKIENMIEMMKYLDDRFELNLILTGSLNAYIDKLKKISLDYSNINFISPIPMSEIPKYINQFDIGVYILEPNSYNNLYALPNKFFEFIQARLAIAIAPSPEMAKIVRQYDCGVVSEDFSPQSLAKSIMQLDIQKINYYKQRSHEAAYELSAEKNKEILLKLVESVLQG